MDTNPFRFGALALDEAFTDRRQELDRLRSDIVNGQDVVIVGRRRFGKSSLVLRVTQEVRARRVLVAYCDLSTTPTKERFAEKLAKAIHDDVASPLFRARERTLSVFRGLRVTPRITIDPHDGSVSFGFDVGHAPADVDATLESLLALPGRLGAERKRKVALVLDEFQEVTEIGRNYPRLMRAVFQTQPEVAHVYLGSKRHLMRRIFSDRNEPFWRSAKQMELGPIPTDQFADYIRSRFAATDRTIADDAVAAILDLTSGHPYATQQLSYFVWEEAAEGAVAGTDDVARGLDRLLESEHNHFSLVWEDSNRTERLMLLALAGGPARVFSADFRRAHRLPAATNVQKAVTRLTARELVARLSRGTYGISEPFLAQWLARFAE
jgi:uncharacterized protein